MFFHPNRTAHWAVGVLLALVLEPTRCGVPTVRAEAAEIPSARMITEGKTAQGFPYLFGGISSNEREVMEQRAKGYNVKLVFADKSGAFLSDISIVLTGTKSGEILSVTTNGPWLYIQLPAGNYSVKATFQGQTKEAKSLKVPENRTLQQTFIWDLGEESKPRG